MILAITAAFFGCYPKESGKAGEFDVVVTAYDSTYNFSKISTYFMADTVIAITDPDNPENNLLYGHRYDSVILSELLTQLNSLGYQRIYDTVLTKPDVAMVVNMTATTGNAYKYYPWLSPYNFAVGTVIITMKDSLNIVWLGAVNGVGQGSDVESRIQQGIKQLFIQSPYL